MKQAVILSGGDINNYDFARQLCKDSFVICADSGIRHCTKMNIKADICTGDFDSFPSEDIPNISCLKNARIIRLKPEKDDTDTEFACMYAVKAGFKHIVLLGGCGSRLDHTLTNIHLVEKMYSFGAKMTVYYLNNRLRMLENSTLKLKKQNYRYVSIIAADRCADGITTCGLKYPLVDETLYRDSSRGVSNELVEETAAITVRNGRVFVIESAD